MNTSGMPLTKPTRSVAPVVQVGVNPELGHQQEVVVLRVLPVDDSELLRQRRAIRLTHGHLDTVAHQRVDLLVRTGVVHGGARPRDLGDRLLDGLGRHAWIEPLDRGAQSPDQEHLRPVVAAERSVRPEFLVVRVDVIPAEFLEQPDRWLLDQLVLAVLA